MDSFCTPEIEALADEARAGISDYCINECKALCCHKGFLIATKAEAQKITGERLDMFIEQERVKPMDDGNFSIDLNKTCPSLVDGRCSIHKDPLRPRTCHKFPIFVFESSKTVQLSTRCPAVLAGKFYVFEHEAKKRGYKLQ